MANPEKAHLEALEQENREMREALKRIAYMRPLGATPKLVKGELIESMEKVALAALHQKETVS